MQIVLAWNSNLSFASFSMSLHKSHLLKIIVKKKNRLNQRMEIEKRNKTDGKVKLDEF